jgi:hypothetical protein
MSAADDAVFEGLWSKVVEAFDDDERHAKFIECCSRQNRLADGARRYREHKEGLGDDASDELRELVDKKLATVAMLAVQQLEASREPPPKNQILRVMTIVAALVCLGAVLGLAKALLGP